MAQFVIFAPKGEDASAGEQALKDAGHEVEVVEANAANLLHMAIGMLEGGEEPEAEMPSTESEPSPDELPEAEEEVKESLGMCLVNDVLVEAFKAKRDRLIVTSLVLGPKVSYSINESQISFWPSQGGSVSAPASTIKVGKKTATVSLELAEGNKARLEVGPKTLQNLFII